MNTENFLFIIFAVVAALCVAVVILTNRSEAAIRFTRAVPLILDEIGKLVGDADRLTDKIQQEYANEALKTGLDARLLWVVDKTLAYVKQHNVSVDRQWVIDNIERFVANNKLKG